MSRAFAILSLLDTYRSYGIDSIMDDIPYNHYDNQSHTIQCSLQALRDFGKSDETPYNVQHKLNNTAELNSPYITKPEQTRLPSPPPPQSITSDIQTPRPESSQDIASVTTLAELKHLIENSTGCDLKKIATHTVFGSGNPHSAIMFIGEAPGEEEDKTGTPFVGKSGKLLDVMLQSVNIKREDVYVTNAVPWRPLGNDNPKTDEINFCLPFLRKHIALVNPKIIIPLGNIPIKAVLQTRDGVNTIHGDIFELLDDHTGVNLTKELQNKDIHSRVKIALQSLHANKTIVIPTFHPSLLLRSPSFKRHVWQNFLLVKKIIEAL